MASLYKINKGLRLKGQPAAPSSPQDGSIYYDSVLGYFQFRQNGVWSQIPTGAYNNGGNSFGIPAILGTNDTFSLSFETDGVTKTTIDTAGRMGFVDGTIDTFSYLTVNPTARPLTGTSMNGMRLTVNIPSTATSGANGLLLRTNTDAGAFTAALIRPLAILQDTKGAGSTITRYSHITTIINSDSGTNNALFTDSQDFVGNFGVALQSLTRPSVFNHSVTIGYNPNLGAINQAWGLRLYDGTLSFITGTSQYGFLNTATFTQTATTEMYGVYSQVQSINSSFTTPIVANFYARIMNKGASNTWTRAMNYLGDHQTAATNNAYMVDNTSFTGNWVLNFNSTRNSQITGAMRLGAATTDIVGTGPEQMSLINLSTDQTQAVRGIVTRATLSSNSASSQAITGLVAHGYRLATGSVSETSQVIGTQSRIQIDLPGGNTYTNTGTGVQAYQVQGLNNVNSSTLAISQYSGIQFASDNTSTGTRKTGILLSGWSGATNNAEIADNITFGGSYFINSTSTRNSSFLNGVLEWSTTNHQFQGSNPGGDMLGTIYNTSNTASSGAKLLIQVAGTSAGKAMLQLGASGVSNYQMFYDTADSNKFKLQDVQGPISLIEYQQDSLNKRMSLMGPLGGIDSVVRIGGNSVGLQGSDLAVVRATHTSKSDNTGNFYSFNANSTTANTAYTTSFRYGFYNTNTTKGAASTITRDIGFGGVIPTQGTHNAFMSDYTAFTGSWGLFIVSANPSHINGHLYLGTNQVIDHNSEQVAIYGTDDGSATSFSACTTFALPSNTASASTQPYTGQFIRFQRTTTANVSESNQNTGTEYSMRFSPSNATTYTNTSSMGSLANIRLTSSGNTGAGALAFSNMAGIAIMTDTLSGVTRKASLFIQRPSNGTNNASIADNSTFSSDWFINQTSAANSKFTASTLFEVEASGAASSLFDYFGSNSGGGTTFRAYNIANTAGSAAIMRAQVAGSSAGNAFSQYRIDGITNDWNAGVDNINGDAYRIANNASSNLSSNNYFQIATSGVVSLGDALPHAFSPSSYTFQRANIGNPLTILVDNTDNTSNTTTASFLARVGGSVAGDPTYVLSITGGENWAMGIDNSDSDYYKISNSNAVGTNDRLIIQTDNLVRIAGGITSTGSAGATFSNLGFRGPHWVSNARIEFNQSASQDFTLNTESGTNPSSTNPVYISIGSTTQQANVCFKITSVFSFIDSSGSSDIIGEEFGTTAGVAWANDRPFYIYAINSDDTDAGVMLAISPHPCLSMTPTATSGLGYKANPAATPSDNNMWLMGSSLTLGNFTSKPCTRIGAMVMTKNTSDDWLIVTADSEARDGAGITREPYVGTYFTMPTGQQGAAAGGYILSNGGTAPAFTTQQYQYQVGLDGRIICYVFLDGDAGTDGAGAVSTKIAAPYLVVDVNGTAGVMWNQCRITSTPAGSNMFNVIANQGAKTFEVFNNAITQINLSVFGNGGRTIQGQFQYLAFKRSNF